MNKIWSIIICTSILLLVFTDPSSFLPSLLTGSEKALSLSFELLFIYAIWLGIIKIIDKTPISGFISKLLSPVINLIWGKNINQDAKKNLSLMVSTSLLGIGNASIPLGIKAVEKLDDKSGTITFPIIMTIVFASSGLQLLPTTIMSLMTSCGSVNPEFIIIPTLISSLATLTVGTILAKLLNKISLRKKSRPINIIAKGENDK